MIGYKLFRKRKDGSYGPLFINQKLKLLPGIVYEAGDFKTKGYAHRPGWHICKEPKAPHLSEKNRVWCLVDFSLKQELQRPEHQGGTWYLGNTLQILKEV